MTERRNQRKLARLKRHSRIRHSMNGNAERPRLCIFRSAKHIYAQLVDDESKRTLTAVSSLSPAFRKELTTGSNKAAAKLVGELIAKKALNQGIKKVVFDRGGYLYHGRIKVLAESARESGLVF